jgi:TDG/mug DNA glycosylase family protein
MDLQNAVDKTVADVIKPNLDVLFCGINPGLYTAATGYHFGRPGNRFWKVLYASGFTPRLFSPHEQGQLLSLGYGITNVVNRATASANELTKQELENGGRRLERKILQYSPRWLAVLGIGAYRHAFAAPLATIGLQKREIRNTKIWVLPNPSGLNAHYTSQDLSNLFTEFLGEVKK